LVGKVSVRYYYTNFLDKKRDFREGFGSDCFEDFERGFRQEKLKTNHVTGRVLK
jgi:hypothetical protein